MKYTSERGEFASLQQLRAAYLASSDGAKYWLDPTPFAPEEWEPDTLHASDIGSCPRKVAYRLSHAPQKPRSSSSEANRAIMFWAGYRLHYLTYSALEWADLLLCHEQPVDFPKDWGGRLDAIIFPDHTHPENKVLYDMKTVLPNALKYSYDMPKAKDCLQIGSYALFRPDNIQDGVIEYCDRAGSNTPKECEVMLGHVWPLKASDLMKTLEAARDGLPDLPDTLPQTYAPHFKWDGSRMNLDSIDLVTPWDCGYCDYHLTRKEKRLNPVTKRQKEYGWTCADSLCKPVNAPPVQVATYNNGELFSVTTGHEKPIVEWMATQVTSYVPTEEE